MRSSLDLVSELFIAIFTIIPELILSTCSHEEVLHYCDPS